MRHQYPHSSIPTIFTSRTNTLSLNHGYQGITIAGKNLPLRLRYFICLIIIYVLAGITLSSLWRGIDANTYSVLLGLFGDTYFQADIFKKSVATAPAYYRLLELGVKIFSGFFSPANGMRITNAVLLLLGLIALYRALRRAYSPESATVTVLVITTCLGGLEFMHLSGPHIGSFFALCVSLYGISVSFTRIYGGFIMGMGFVLSIMMGGGTLIPVLIPALLLLLYQQYYVKTYSIFTVSMLLALSMMGVTLLNLYIFTGRSALEVNLWLPNYSFHTWTAFFDALFRIFWFTWPLWPTFIAFRLYSRKRWNTNTPKLITIGGLGGLLAIPFSLSGLDAPMRLLPFLAFLFAPSLLLLSSTWQRAWHWFNFLFFSIAFTPIIIVRLLWVTQYSSTVNALVEDRLPGYPATLSITQIIGMIVILLIWCYWNIVAKSLTSWIFRPALGWVIGMVCLWVLTIVLWIGPVDYVKSYQHIIENIHKVTEKNCVDAQKTPFSFQVNWRYLTQSPVIHQTTCAYRLEVIDETKRTALLSSKNPPQIMLLPKNETIESSAIYSNPPSHGWQAIRLYQRPGETFETLVLYINRGLLEK